MRKIPDDIAAEAASICASVGITDSHARKVFAAAIARAIRAERQRCADVVRASFRHGMDGQACRWILAAIEAGQA